MALGLEAGRGRQHGFDVVEMMEDRAQRHAGAFRDALRGWLGVTFLDEREHGLDHRDPVPFTAENSPVLDGRRRGGHPGSLR